MWDLIMHTTFTLLISWKSTSMNHDLLAPLAAHGQQLVLMGVVGEHVGCWEHLLRGGGDRTCLLLESSQHHLQ